MGSSSLSLIGPGAAQMQDLNMLTCTEGEERTLREYEQLLTRAGFGAVWIGEMATYDAFALATAVGLRAPGMTLKIGPLAVGVRGPVTLALGVSSVASLTGSRVDIALGASSPAIVAGWFLVPKSRDPEHGALDPVGAQATQLVEDPLARRLRDKSGLRTRELLRLRIEPEAELVLEPHAAQQPERVVVKDRDRN